MNVILLGPPSSDATTSDSVTGAPRWCTTGVDVEIATNVRQLVAPIPFTSATASECCEVTTGTTGSTSVTDG